LNVPRKTIPALPIAILVIMAPLIAGCSGLSGLSDFSI
jgi:hypothetical protein